MHPETTSLLASRLFHTTTLLSPFLPPAHPPCHPPNSNRPVILAPHPQQSTRQSVGGWS
ncbi:hypothetical protein CALCODRAFT_499546 [Calocera cornea HHB12733]|uniref:Uncharacterized protein n=1 Tax=Calocera cornea HHB12733 TaxID=1353952 RepID=A0A165EER4_9BASI|nr:hypothetical protein CALCODRAFT_499546 [Calocera cornea HHB12733]